MLPSGPFFVLVGRTREIEIGSEHAMTHKEGIDHLTNDRYKDLNTGKICIDAEKADAFLEAVGLGIKAMKALSAEPTEDQPLSLEQMREMDGQPVWYKRAEQWFIIELHHPDFGECVINASGYYIPLKKASKREFYAYPPTKTNGETLNCAVCDYLDREYVPCAHCIGATKCTDRCV